MSKNGKLLFRGYDPYVTNSFGYKINPITNINTLHAGVDYGTNLKKLPTYAIEDGKVLETGFSNTNGNYVYVNFKRLKKNALYQHLDTICVSDNQLVNKDTIIGYVGETGEDPGIHLHFGWFDEAEQNKGWYDRKWEDFEKYEYPEIISYLASPVIRDTSVNQVEVLVNNLRARNMPNGNILGYINKGIYNILETKIEREYAWLMVSEGVWIAYDKSWAKLYEVEVLEENKEGDTKTDEVIDEEISDETEEDYVLEDVTYEEKSLFRKIITRIREIFKKTFNFFSNM